MSLLIVGTVAFDKIETPFGKTDKILGGAATYAGLAAGLFTKDVNLVSVVGGDFPEPYLQMLTSRNMHTGGIKVIPDGKTFFWSGKYHDNMNQRDTLVTELNVLADFDPVLPDSYKKCRYVLLGNLTPRIQRQVIEQMEARPELICMDTMNFWMNTAMDDLVDVLTMVDVLAVNEEEARQLSGEYALPRAARKIMDMGPRVVIIKKGEHGAILFDGPDMFYSPSVLLDHVTDPTGAGDSFAGGFMGYIARAGSADFETLKKALMYASVVASFTVEHFGAEGLMHISGSDIADRMKAFRAMTRVDM